MTRSKWNKDQSPSKACRMITRASKRALTGSLRRRTLISQLAYLEHEDDPVILEGEPVGRDVRVPQPRLPDGGDVLRLLGRGVPADLDEHHDGLALLGGAHHAVRVAHVQLGEVDGGLRPARVPLGQLVGLQRLLVLLPLLVQPLEIMVANGEKVLQAVFFIRAEGTPQLVMSLIFF